MNNHIKNALREKGKPYAPVLEGFIQILIVLSLVGFSVETLPGLSPEANRVLHLLEVWTVGIFTVEYVLRALLAPTPGSYLLSFWGLIDLLAILPFYLQTGLDLRSIRILRLLRLFRMLKLARYHQALRRFARAFRLIQEELVLFLTASAMLIYLAAVGIYHFEHEAQPQAFASVFHALWWAMVTLTTVGYGDVYPITPGGKIFTALLLLIGLGVVAVPAGLVASALSEARRMEASQTDPGESS